MDEGQRQRNRELIADGRDKAQWKPPAFCVACGHPLIAVRHLMSNAYEAQCDRCGLPFVVMMNDFQKF